MRQLVLVMATLAAAIVMLGGIASAQAQPEFKLGFKALADLIPGIAGQPLDNETHNPVNGDGLQRTTTGLMVWRKADNWTAFTDGSQTWINGPLGLQSRPNSERFDWEAGAQGDPAVGEQVWQQKPCMNCHGPMAQGNVGPRLAGTGLSFDQVMATVRAGRGIMPSFSPGQVSDQELRHLYAWLQSLR